MKTSQVQVTPADIIACCGYIAHDPSAYPLRHPLPTTPGRRKRQALLAVARDALGPLLIERHGLKNFKQLTRAIRAGHAGDATDFDAINLAAAQALGLLEN